MQTTIITGFHAIEERVLSLSKSKKTPKNYTIFFSKPGPRVRKILDAAKKLEMSTSQKDDAFLDELVKNLPESLQDHRGIVLQIEGQEEKQTNIVDFDAWIKNAQKNKESDDFSTVIILDRVTDPHNVGAILRSADQFGASLVVLPEHKSANDVENNDVIARSSAGASAWVPTAIVNNLVRAVEQLKDAGYWVYGADAGGETCGKINFAKKSVIVMGSEGSGIAQLLEKQCDSIVSIPTCGKIDSLNVSVAAGVLLYELYRRQN